MYASQNALTKLGISENPKSTEAVSSPGIIVYSMDLLHFITSMLEEITYLILASELPSMVN